MMGCPNCKAKIPSLSFICPKCGTKLRERKEPSSKGVPKIYFQPLPPGIRSSIAEEDGKLVGIKISTEHEDYEKAKEEGFELLYITTLISKEVSKFKFGEDNNDYTDEMLGLLVAMFSELMKINAIRYKEISTGLLKSERI